MLPPQTTRVLVSVSLLSLSVKASSTDLGTSRCGTITLYCKGVQIPHAAGALFPGGLFEGACGAESAAPRGLGGCPDVEPGATYNGCPGGNPLSLDEPDGGGSLESGDDGSEFAPGCGGGIIIPGGPGRDPGAPPGQSRSFALLRGYSPFQIIGTISSPGPMTTLLSLTEDVCLIYSAMAKPHASSCLIVSGPALNSFSRALILSRCSLRLR